MTIFAGMSTQGGKRKGAGRKKVKDKKVPVSIGVRKSIIKKYGGKKLLSKKLTKYAEAI